MTQTVSAGEEREGEIPGGKTVVVGVKFDSHSRELLTWALMKEAQPGDHVIALHVLSNNEIVDRDGKSSLLALVKAFDTVLTVYKGFCNLKQVDLKLKVCRGSSVRKVLVREARSYFANEVIVGTARKHRTIRSSAFVAKYCAKKLRKDCSVLAVDNGKTVFHREASPVTDSCEKGIDVGQHRFLSVIQKSMLSKSFNVLCIANGNENPPASGYLDSSRNSELPLVKSGSQHEGSAMKQNCSICSSNNSMLLENSRVQSTESSTSGDGDESNSMVESASSSTSMPIKGMPELRFGWPLLRRVVISDRQVSLGQGTMQLPNRNRLLSAYSKQSEWNREENQPSESDVESGVISLVGTEILSAPTSPSSSRSLPEELEGFYEKYSSTCRLFKYHELLQATSYFNSDNLIGKGGNSKVYRGRLSDEEKEIAVKSLRPSVDVLKEFVLEIEIITALHHKNIMSLYGLCFEDGNLLLVYDFLSRGSVEDNLHGNKNDPCSFGWSERYMVAVNVAEALEYLHNECAKPVIHGDVKSSNILLSEDFYPQLSDFGLAKWASTTSSHITSKDVSGTFGYLAPEYFMFGKVNDKIDVYAFGVVLLELLSGRKPINNDLPKGQESLVMWAKPILNGGKLVHLLDPCLAKNYNSDQMERMVLAAILCIRRAPRGRPQMSIVLKLLQGDLEVIKWARVQITSSEGSDMLEDESFPPSNLQSHINLALFDVHEDSLSMSSIDQTLSIEDYLRGRWSRSSSFD